MKSTKNGKKKKLHNYKINWNLFYFVLLFSTLCSFTILNAFTMVDFIGAFSVSFISLSILFMDIYRYKPHYTSKRKMKVLLGIIIFGTMFFANITEYLFFNLSKGIGSIPEDVVIFGVPVQSAAMLAALLFDSHTAIIVSFIVGILTGIWQQDAFYTFYVFTGSIVASFSMISCKKRTDIIRGGLFVSLANAICIMVIIMLNKNIPFIDILPAIIFALISGILLSAFVSIILPILEYLFKITTNITLLEFLDLNQPLMKNLMINAPGTYHHSVIVGNLVEAVAEHIGVNSLHARVSAYYHDIGKMKMPEYFVENQSGALNKHEKLTPHMSSMILISHVKEGLELAEEYNLPESVMEGITQHHGTKLISFFYNKAKDGQADFPKEEDYRYPGPKPQSKVAALIMIADAVEASSRTVKDPTSARVKNLVGQIVNNILIDGQLDECDLTLKDIHVIKERFAHILIGILHKRIEYPGFDFNKPIGIYKDGKTEQSFITDPTNRSKSK